MPGDGKSGILDHPAFSRRTVDFIAHILAVKAKPLVSDKRHMELAWMVSSLTEYYPAGRIRQSIVTGTIQHST